MDTQTELPGQETDLADLSGIGFDDLPPGQDDALEPFRETLLAQVDRPRINLGSGPPGRID